MSMIDGKELIITPASFLEAMALKEAIASALKKSGTKFDLSSIDIKNIDLDNIENTNVGDIGWIFEHILTLGTDSSIRNILFKCAERAVFGKDKEKVNTNFFDNVENRKYYYPIMMEVLKVNISPFFGLKNSLFQKLEGLTEKFLKSKSTPQK